MLLTMMKSKLHRATVTQADLDYEGSIAIDRDLLDASGILPHEQVDVLNITNGARFTTYAIEAPRGSNVCRGDGERRACLARYAGVGRGQPPEVEPGHFDGLWQEIGRSLAPSYAAGTLGERNLAAELDLAFEHDRCMRESGHDTTYRWFWAEGGSQPSNRCADMLTVPATGGVSE